MRINGGIFDWYYPVDPTQYSNLLILHLRWSQKCRRTQLRWNLQLSLLCFTTWMHAWIIERNRIRTRITRTLWCATIINNKTSLLGWSLRGNKRTSHLSRGRRDIKEMSTELNVFTWDGCDKKATVPFVKPRLACHRAVHVIVCARLATTLKYHPGPT